MKMEVVYVLICLIDLFDILENPLHLVLMGAIFDTIFSYKGYLNVVKFLINKGVNIHATDIYQRNLFKDYFN